MFGYVLCLAPEFVALILFFMYICSKDSEYSRKTLPLIMLLTALTAFLLILWIIIYIYCIYPYDEVYNGSGEKAPDGQEDTNYTKQPKWAYCLYMCSLWLANVIFYVW